MLDEWAEVVRRELGIPAADYPEDTVDLVLGTARDVAHGVARPAAPLTAYLLGLAVARAADGGAAAPELAARVSRLAADWNTRPPTTEPSAADGVAGAPTAAPATDGGRG